MRNMASILKNCSSRLIPFTDCAIRTRPAITAISNNNTAAAIRNFHQSAPLSKPKKTVKIIYIDPMDKEIPVDAEVGRNLLDIAHDHNIELEGACGAELACATCHLIFEKNVYDTLPEKEPEEDDMLDLAFELTDTSRLGCQITVTEDMEGMRVRIPDDGY